MSSDLPNFVASLFASVEERREESHAQHPVSWRHGGLVQTAWFIGYDASGQKIVRGSCLRHSASASPRAGDLELGVSCVSRLQVIERTLYTLHWRSVQPGRRPRFAT